MDTPRYPIEKQHRDVLLSWIASGDSVAIYQNMALDSASAGRVFPLRVGPTCTFKEAPKQAPDTPQYGFGWKYRLQMVAKTVEGLDTAVDWFDYEAEQAAKKRRKK